MHNESIVKPNVKSHTKKYFKKINECANNIIWFQANVAMYHKKASKKLKQVSATVTKWTQ